MRLFRILLAHELRMLLVSPATYIAATLFLLVMGFVFAGILETFTAAPQEAAPAAVFFQLFWLPVFFMVPLLTMKSLAEERRLGTLETLLTTPATTPQVVLAKFAAAYALYLSLWAATAGFFYILVRFGAQSQPVDLGPLLGGYLFIAVSGTLFIALGILASSTVVIGSLVGSCVTRQLQLLTDQQFSLQLKLAEIQKSLGWSFATLKKIEFSVTYREGYQIKLLLQAFDKLGYCEKRLLVKRDHMFIDMHTHQSSRYA
jgi:ABC-type transport system involved in cytochrome c biogenesis permease component